MGATVLGADYQVFLSFRGSDTRQGFTDCLYHFLVDEGVRVFRDNEELRPGERIQEILRAINKSVVCIPIFSKNYASSKWCLRELAEMVEKKKKILPVFYDVTPDDVKLKTDLYHGVLNRRHEKEAEKEKWEKALEEVLEVSGWEDPSEAKEENAFHEAGGIKGWEVKDKGHGELCKSIVKQVLFNLKVKDRIVSDHLVGMKHRAKDLLSNLDLEAPGVLYVGIYGMGGSGKSTLTKTVFNQLCHSFQACSFLADIRETARHAGLLHLQKKLLSDLEANRSSEQISDTDGGIKALSDICRSRKTLLVLDDVDGKEQIECLAGSSSWFRSGSRIIITTRDVRVLENQERLEGAGGNGGSKPVGIMEMKEMDFDAALQLFSIHAFKKVFPPADYLDISKEVVKAVGRLPLLLETIGSHLYSKDREEWEEKRSSLAKMAKNDIQKVLMLSYQGLDFRTKQIFLDIACLPANLKRAYAVCMWRSCGFHPEIGIEVLRSQLLVKVVDGDGMFWMHDDVRALGREIVSMENFMDLGERSRLWDPKEALGVLERQEGTGKIEVLQLCDKATVDEVESLEYLRKRKRESQRGSFIRVPSILSDIDYYMESSILLSKHLRNPSRNLRFLALCGPKIMGYFEFAKLRWLSWQICPPTLKSVTLKFDKLAVLDLSRSAITDNWNGWNNIKGAELSLQVIDLSGCEIEKLPDLSAYVKLERLILDHCLKLEKIDRSIDKLKCLKHLSLKDCRSLISLSEEIGSLEMLEELVLDSTPVRELPITIVNLRRLRRLSLSCLFCLQWLPEAIGNMESLIELNLTETMSMKKLPDSLGGLKKLERLYLQGCFDMEKLPDSFGNLKLLPELDLSLTRITELPDSFGGLRKLERLRLRNCASIKKKLPDSFGDLKSLSELDLSFTIRDYPPAADYMLELPDTFGGLEKLERLYLRSCPIKKLPDSFGYLKSLRELDLSGTLISELPGSFGGLVKLEHLSLGSCHCIKKLPGSFGELKSLSKLDISFSALDELPGSFRDLKELKEIKMEGCNIPIDRQNEIAAWINGLIVIDIHS